MMILNTNLQQKKSLHRVYIAKLIIIFLFFNIITVKGSINNAIAQQNTDIKLSAYQPSNTTQLSKESKTDYTIEHEKQTQKEVQLNDDVTNNNLNNQFSDLSSHVEQMYLDIVLENNNPLSNLQNSPQKNNVTNVQQKTNNVDVIIKEDIVAKNAKNKKVVTIKSSKWQKFSNIFSKGYNGRPRFAFGGGAGGSFIFGFNETFKVNVNDPENSFDIYTTNSRTSGVAAYGFLQFNIIDIKYFHLSLQPFYMYAGASMTSDVNYEYSEYYEYRVKTVTTMPKGLGGAKINIGVNFDPKWTVYGSIGFVGVNLNKDNTYYIRWIDTVATDYNISTSYDVYLLYGIGAEYRIINNLGLRCEIFAINLNSANLPTFTNFLLGLAVYI